MARHINSSILHSRDALEPLAMTQKNVVGVGIGRKVTGGKKQKELAVVAMVTKKVTKASLAWDDRIPAHSQGIPVDVVEVGHIEALKARTDKWRPAPGGVSIGHFMITAGTLGVYVKDNISGKTVILSNNHVLANSNDADYGDPIYQPGPIDGGGINDKIATLIRFIPIDFGEDEPTCNLAETYTRFGNWLAGIIGSQHRVSAKKYNPQAVNLVDAATAIPVSPDVIDGSIIDVGIVSGVEDGSLGMKVKKSGRTTEATTGLIELVNATIQVDYGDGKVATFRDQYVSGFMSKGGDSGSLLVTNNKEPKAVGLLFAGSNTTTVYNPIKHVISALNITI